MACCLVYMTAADQDEAERIGETLVKERLAACVNILPAICGLFHWDGAVQKDSEVVFLAKTTMERFEALRRRVRELHSYDLPCIVALPIVDGDPEFLAWIGRETGGGEAC